VRYGIRRADDPLIVDSLKVVDAVLKRELPAGVVLAALQRSGGQRRMEGPFRAGGKDVVPLLIGERATTNWRPATNLSALAGLPPAAR